MKLKARMGTRCSRSHVWLLQEPGLDPPGSHSSGQGSPITVCVGAGSISLGKGKIFSKNPWDNYSTTFRPLWRPVRNLAETFLVPFQAKFSSSYPWELTAQTWRPGGFREELLKKKKKKEKRKKEKEKEKKKVYHSSFFTLPSWGSPGPQKEG